MQSSSSSGREKVALITGAAPADADVIAGLRFGENGGPERGGYEYMVIQRGSAAPPPQARGRLTWDPSYTGPGSRFFTVAPVRLDVRPEQVRWSVGTAEFIDCAGQPYRRIEKVQVVASAVARPHETVVNWDWITLTVHDARGGRHVIESPCLPRAVTGSRTRRSAQRGPALVDSRQDRVQQYAEFSVPDPEFRLLELRGQITMGADELLDRHIGADDLQAAVQLFTRAD